MDRSLVAMVAAQLQGGGHPDAIHEVQAPRFVKMAIALINEADKQVSEIEKAAAPAQ